MRILVTYASGFGSTAEVAEAIGQVLGQRAEVTVEEVQDLISIEPYDAVLIGSPVRAGKWLRRATSFLKKHQSKLTQKPVACFTLCLTAKDEAGRQRASKEIIEPLLNEYPLIKPIAVGLFGGKIEYQKLPWLIRGVIKRVSKKEGFPTEGVIDFRDWDAIRAWGEEVGSRLEQN